MKNSHQLVAFAFLVGCSGKTLDVGSDESPIPITPSNRPSSPLHSSDPLPEWPDASQCTPDPSLPMAGTWSGYFEDAESGSWMETFELRFVSGDSNGVCGSLVFGDVEPPPPPADPEAWYPPTDFPPPPGARPDTVPWPGFVYTLLDGSVAGERVRFSISLAELYNSWCALQTPIADLDGYNCVPNGEGWWLHDNQCSVTNPLTDTVDEYSCAQVGLCHFGQVCACNETSCTGNLVGSHAGTYSFDISFEGSQAVGSSGGATLRLERVD